MASVADFKNGIEVEPGVENPFAFGNWRLALVEPRKSSPRTHCLENVLYDFEYNLEIHHRKQLSSLAKTDFYNTNILLDSTRNAPKRSHATNECHIYADDVYARLEDSSDDR